MCTEIFARMCRLLLQGGHTEKAIAHYQAMLEYTLFYPSLLSKASQQDQMEFLEAFWESPSARFGEDGAVGWGRWMELKGEVSPIKPWSSKGASCYSFL